MTINKNAVATTDIAWSTAARNLIAAHPHLAGLGVAAIAAALSHLYYGHKAVTVVAMAAAGLITGEAVSRILAHAQEIEDTAAEARAAGEALRAMAAKLPQVEAAMGGAWAEVAGLKAEVAKLREEHAVAAGVVRVEVAQAEAFRQVVLAAKAKAEAPAETPVVEAKAEPKVEAATPAEAPAAEEAKVKKVVRKPKAA